MLCRKCWTEEASVHFRYVCGGEAHDLSYCLACAQHEPWSWLFAWRHGRALAAGGMFPKPIVVHAEPAAGTRVTVIPHVVCGECYAVEGHPVIGTARTCLRDEQRRRLVDVDEALQRGRATWGTFSVRN